MPDEKNALQQELIKDLRRLYKQRGDKRPRTIDVQNDKERPNYVDYIKCFGSWKNALKEAGVDKEEIAKEFGKN
jgi:hypothetical protein